jgi:histone H3
MARASANRLNEPRTQTSYYIIIYKDSFHKMTLLKKQLKKRKFRPGIVALREIRQQQNICHLEKAIRKAAFARLVREVTNTVSYEPLRWTATALEALQEATEYVLIELLEESNLCAIHAKRQTIVGSFASFLNHYICHKVS